MDTLIRDLILIILGIAIYSYLLEPNWIEVNRIHLGSKLKIVHLSDLHLTEIGYRENLVLNIVKDEKPDIIVITGDLIEDKKYINTLNKFLEELSEISPVLIVYGNHDPNLDNLSSNRIKILKDNIYYYKGYCFLGLTYPNDHFIKFPNNCTKKIVLAHSPEVIGIYQGKADVILVGHTHGGQVRLPLIGAIYLPVKQEFRKYDMGLFEREGTFMYVNKGIGVWSLFPFRFLCRPEVAVIYL